MPDVNTDESFTFVGADIEKINLRRLLFKG